MDNTEQLTKDRGANYGHPRAHFPLTQGLYVTWKAARYRQIDQGAPELDATEEACLRHGVYMICDKLARAATNPKHVDNWDDIAGYSLCIKRALGLAE